MLKCLANYGAYRNSNKFGQYLCRIFMNLPQFDGEACLISLIIKLDLECICTAQIYSSIDNF